MSVNRPCVTLPAVDAPSYYTPDELTELFPSIPRQQWYSWSARGKIRTVKSAGRDMLVPASEVERVLGRKFPMTSLYKGWTDKL